MIRTRRNIGKHGMRCYWGCCMSYPDARMERKIIKKREKREWKKEIANVAG